ncbi:heavy-metal-associated domain-containing protein [Acidobacteria bacterium AH-259-G07]|nr:heavy-metal-associated domain-containing protein [Acidobacteria bacterium AH-259-G07]
MRKIFLALVLMILAAPFGAAQVKKVTIEVDGLTCPFCAYGLEKRLSKIEGVREVKIFVDQGKAELEARQEGLVDLQEVEPAVRKAGFTPRIIRVEATGQVVDWNGEPALLVAQGQVRFVLDNAELIGKLQELLAEKGTQSKVTLTGRLKEIVPEGHHGHPLTLWLERYEIS